MARVCAVLLVLTACAGHAAGGSPLQGIASVYRRAEKLNDALFFPEADGTTYVKSGDIDAMWLRDSSIQSMALLQEKNRNLVRGVILRQERLIALDPYANAFHSDYTVAERKFELDSLCYPVKLVQLYVRTTKDASIYDSALYTELTTILTVFLVEQHHSTESSYHSNERPIEDGIGLVWGAYRPSDDPESYNYNVPGNMFVEDTLYDMAEIFAFRYHDLWSAVRAEMLAAEVKRAIHKYAIFTTRYGRIYAYSVDGLGHAKFMDDANTPSLLAIPLITRAYDKDVYAATRRFVLGRGNPYYYSGKYASGEGSAHTPKDYVWPLALIVQYRTAASDAQRARILSELSLSNAGDGVLHESFDVNNPRRFTRPRFGWPNALFVVVFLNRSRPHPLKH